MLYRPASAEFPVQSLALDSGSPKRGGALIFSFVGNLPVLDPPAAGNRPAQQICSCIYEGLVKYNPGGNGVLPSLASKWTHSSGKIWTFYLRRDVKFHDGKKFDSASVKFNFDRLLNPRHPNSKPSYGTFSFSKSLLGIYGDIVEKIETPDSYTVRFTLSSPDYYFPEKLAHYSYGIVSPYAVKKYGNLFHEHPCGTGPFRMAELRKPGRIILSSNSAYSLFSPYLDKIIFETYLDYESSQRQIARGNIDIVLGLSMDKMNWEYNDSSVLFKELAVNDFTALAFNCRKKYFSSAKNRRIIADLINRRALASKFGVEPASSFLFPGVGGYERRALVYSPAESAEHIRRTEELSSQTFTLLCPAVIASAGFDTVLLAEDIAGFLKAGGIKVKIKTFSLYDYKRLLVSGGYDMAIYYEMFSSPEPDVILSSLWSPNAYKAGRNISRFSDSNLNQLLVKGRNAKTLKEKNILYKKADQMLITALPMLPLFYTRQPLAYLKSVNNIGNEPSGALNLSKVWLSE